MSQYAQPGYGYGAATGGRAVEDGYGGGYDQYGGAAGGYAPEGGYAGQQQGQYGADGQYEPYSDQPYDYNQDPYYQNGQYASDPSQHGGDYAHDPYADPNQQYSSPSYAPPAVDHGGEGMALGQRNGSDGSLAGGEQYGRDGKGLKVANPSDE